MPTWETATPGRYGQRPAINVRFIPGARLNGALQTARSSWRGSALINCSSWKQLALRPYPLWRPAIRPLLLRGLAKKRSQSWQTRRASRRRAQTAERLWWNRCRSNPGAALPSYRRRRRATCSSTWRATHSTRKASNTCSASGGRWDKAVTTYFIRYGPMTGRLRRQRSRR